MQKEIRHTWYFKQSPEEVWRYLTQPELLEQWMMKTDFQPVEGHKFRLFGPGGKVSYCEVVEIKPFSRLAFSWLAHSADMTRDFDSLVTWTLTPVESGTELLLVHNGFMVLQDFIGYNTGWTALGNQFVELLNARL